MSIQVQPINNGESGAVVRAKINTLFVALIDGTEGINNVWSQIRELAKSTETLGENLDEIDQKTVKTTQDLVAYTNKEVYGLLQYINALKSNTPGLIPDTSYNPQVALEDSAAFIAVGPGTFTHFKDSSNQPITISEDSAVNIFYKAAGVSYYTYKGIVVNPFGWVIKDFITSASFNPGTPTYDCCYIINVSGGTLANPVSLTNFKGSDLQPLKITRAKEIAIVGYKVSKGYWEFLAEFSSAFSDFG